ncbi:DUF1360 domain-containing protein [Mesobacillus maritimus]|uniref:DUF1360 domain-containing protein n=1 Tax=Mesobacillus maritimus TaxID=1643336 RepID=UPI0020414B2F|nr:DUF1360 domain-containing protein [Mesobacillus maritimus]MCM3586168.1 DUF1360 domain-containing protein [Mesobacillus maritimus]MCM3667495.1 DUF1360 domain-containing protein [Mesobacillus maritimus]
MFLGIDFGTIFLFSLACFRITRLIVFDKITNFIRAPFFDEIEEDGEVFLLVKTKGVKKWIGELLSCYWCTGIWVSLVLVLGLFFLPSFTYPLVLVFAIAAIGSLIETFVSKTLGD